MLSLLKTAYYEFLSLFVVKKVRYKVSGHCNKCGKCCQDIRLKGADDEKDFKLTQFFIPTYRRFVIKGKDENGDLILGCTLQNSDGTCSVYDKRPALCRNFPKKYIWISTLYQKPRVWELIDDKNKIPSPTNTLICIPTANIFTCGATFVMIPNTAFNNSIIANIGRHILKPIST